VTALSIGLGVGGFGIASAASGTATTTGTAAATAAPVTAAPQGAAPHGWGGQRSDETVLTGDALTAVTKAATAKVAGGTIVRVETDADGNAKYEAHMTKADGSLVTVYVDASYNVVGVQTR
jgi:hypothetical protein